MKRFLFSFFLISLFISAYNQDISTMLKLHDLSVKLGSSPKAKIDTQYLKAIKTLMTPKAANQLELLLQSGQFFLEREYVHSGYFIRQVTENFKDPEYRKIKLLLVTATYANEGDALRTAKCYSILGKRKMMDEGNMVVINEQIRDNFTREAFDNALSHYYYYHERKRILDKIYN